MIRRVVKPSIRFAKWAFGPPVPGLDLMLAGLAIGWAFAAGAAPEVFEQQSYAVLRLMPPWAFAGAMAALASAHLATMRRPRHAGLRQAGLLAAGVVWLSVAVGFALAGGWTAVAAYGVVAAACGLGLIYVEAERGHDR
jgi:hypothetical protein